MSQQSDLQQHSWTKIKVAHGGGASNCWYGMQEACDNVLACQTVKCWLKDYQNSGCHPGSPGLMKFTRNTAETQWCWLLLIISLMSYSALRPQRDGLWFRVMVKFSCRHLHPIVWCKCILLEVHDTCCSTMYAAMLQDLWETFWHSGSKKLWNILPTVETLVLVTLICSWKWNNLSETGRFTVF